MNHIVDGGWYTYFLLPVVGPLVGGVVAGWLYMFCAGYQIPDKMPLSNRRASLVDCSDEEKKNLVRTKCEGTTQAFV
jgi:hypothetical protein